MKTARFPLDSEDPEVDASDLQDVEQRLRDSEARLRLALEAIDAGVFDIDLVRGTHRWDRRVRELLGLMPDVAPTAQSWLACLHPQDRHRARREFEDALGDPDHDGVWHLQYRVRKPHGGWRWIEERGKLTYGESGPARRTVRLTGVMFDVTGRVEAARDAAGSTQRLRESEERLRLAMESSSLGYWDSDVVARQMVLSDSAQRFFGLPGHEVVAVDELLDRVHPEDRSRVAAAYARALDTAGDGAFRQQYRILRQDGSVRWIDAMARTHFALADGRQRAMRNVGVMWDVTEQRQAEGERTKLVHELREQRRRLDVVLNNASVAVFLMDERGQCVYMNPAAERLTGYTLAETHGRRLHDVIHHTRPDGTPFPLHECPIDRAFPENNQEQGEEVFVHKDGSFYPVAFTASPIRDETARTVGTIIEARDIRREKETMHALREADRRKDEFLAMLAHELRNPLAPLTNALRVLELGAGLGAREQAMLAMAKRQTGQLRRLVDDLLEVSRISRGKIVLRPGRVAVDDAVRQAVESVDHEISRRGHAVDVRLPDAPIFVRADPARLAQILENLLNNACKYTPDGGRIGVAVIDQGEHVDLRITDNGVGIEPDQVSRLFELFQQIDVTLDRSAGGLGIGLAMVKHLVSLHGGRVWAESGGRGLGTTFTVRLPKDDSASE